MPSAASTPTSRTVAVDPVAGAPSGHSVVQQLSGLQLQCFNEHWSGFGSGQFVQQGCPAQQLARSPVQTHSGMTSHKTSHWGLDSTHKVHPSLLTLNSPSDPGGHVTVNWADTGAAIKHAATITLRQLIRHATSRSLAYAAKAVTSQLASSAGRRAGPAQMSGLPALRSWPVGSSDAFQPPPRAWTSWTLATMRRPRTSTAER